MLQKVTSSFYLRNGFILGTVLLIGYGLQVSAEPERANSARTLIDLVTAALLYGMVLLHNLVIFRRYFTKRYFLLYVLLMMALFVGDYVVTSFLYGLVDEPLHGIVFEVNRAVLLYLCLAVYYCFRYYQQNAELLELRALKHEGELQRLTAQLNPHFLYNALNNIYSHLLVNDAGQSKELILKLSELMRHLTDNAVKDSISLNESLEFLKNYLGFEKERLGARCRIELELQVPENTRVIAPLIFFPLIENAFKHGTNSIKPVTITLRIRLEEDLLSLFIENELLPQASPPSTKAGIRNVKRRLELLYRNRHELETIQTGTHYRVSLTMQLL